MNLRLFVFAATLIFGALARAQEPQKNSSTDTRSTQRFEYAILTQNEMRKRDSVTESSLTWKAPDQKLSVAGTELHKQLLNEMGQKTDNATLYETLNFLGRNGWELCTVLPVREAEVNQFTRYVFKRKALDSKSD